MKYSLRSLMIVTILAPPVLAGSYFVLGTYHIVELRTLLVFGMAGSCYSRHCLLLFVEKCDSMKFTIRDLFWLMPLAAVLTAWGVDHWIANQDYADLMDRLFEEHRKVRFYKGIRP